MLETLAAGIRRHRQRNSLTLRDLASASGITDNELQDLEGGRTDPPLTTVAAIARALGVGIGRLLHAPEQAPPTEASLGAAPARDAEPALRTFITQLTERFDLEGVPWAPLDDLMLEHVGVPLPRQATSYRLLAHTNDRSALAMARDLGATVTMASQSLAEITPPGAKASLLLNFAIPPFERLLRGKLTPVDAALYFVLQPSDDAELRLDAVMAAHGLTRAALKEALERVYPEHSFPAYPQSAWALRGFYDRELATRRLSQAERA